MNGKILVIQERENFKTFLCRAIQNYLNLSLSLSSYSATFVEVKVGPVLPSCYLHPSSSHPPNKYVFFVCCVYRIVIELPSYRKLCPVCTLDNVCRWFQAKHYSFYWMDKKKYFVFDAVSFSGLTTHYCVDIRKFLLPICFERRLVCFLAHNSTWYTVFCFHVDYLEYWFLSTG